MSVKKRQYFVSYVITHMTGFGGRHSFGNDFLNTTEEITRWDIKNFQTQKEKTSMGGQVKVTFFHEVNDKMRLKAAS